MNELTIIEMARKAGGIDLTNIRANVTVWVGTGTSDFLDAFAKLVAEHEREECADTARLALQHIYKVGEFAESAIRARGHKGVAK